MAKKNKPTESSDQRMGISQPESFTHGMISDLDPHFQLKGSYADAQNIRLTNSEGDTFTVENIEGNSLFVDLADYPISVNAGQGADTDINNHATFYDKGPSATSSSNLELSNRCSIVGHVSYANQMLLMIVGRFEWNRGGGTPFKEEKDRTIFLMVDFDHEMKVTKVTDLRVCYNIGASIGQPSKNYPDLNMDLDIPVSIEHIVENNAISRIYWTDNKNQLRTLNIKQERLDLLSKESLDLTPLMNPSQPVLGMTLNGSLPVGVYQYTYKYISENGGESTFAPLSNMYHVSDQSFSSSTTYAGGPKGNLGTQGFQIDIYDLDDSFEYIELYSLFYDTQNQAPRVAVVGRNQVSGTKSTFQHPVWNNEVPNGLEEILIESNTFDVCKDIAIKDNILFAANLRQKRNFISEKEWNVKILRWRINPGTSSRWLDAMLTTNDSEVKHYEGTPAAPVEIGTNGYDTDYNGHHCGLGQLLGSKHSTANPSAYPSAANGGGETYLDYDGNLNNPMWTTCIANQRHRLNATTLNGRVKSKFEYRYLPDRMTLGGESFNYASNGLGGCRVTFGIEEKVADQSENAWSSPFISATSKGDETPTEFFRDVPYDASFPASGLSYTNPIGNTTFKASMNLGGSKDPHLAGNKRGYQRGEVYRFGVQTYDLNGSPGNVLWIGDIETPHQYDILRMVDFKDHYYAPGRKTIGSGGMVDVKHFISHQNVKDHRLSYVYGHTVPPVDVEWFTARLGGSINNDEAYVRHDGDRLNDHALPGNTGSARLSNGRGKSLPAWNVFGDLYGMDYSQFDNIHYLYDLYVAFEFIIPDDVAKKISGFRVVRAERTEEDRRIVQQGVLNQTAQYGDARYGQEAGYDVTKFSRKDNEAFDDDPIFVNQWNDQTLGSSNRLDPTKPEQPEYNVYLNGYLGLAENSHLAFWDNAISDGKTTSGGNTSGKVFNWPEREDSKRYAGGGVGVALGWGVNAGKYQGPGTYGGTHHRHSAYFGSHDKVNQWMPTDTEPYNGNANANQISGSIFTLDSPDSAFGIRPYLYKEGDMLRIDCAMKLTDEVRFKNQAGVSWFNDLPHHHWSHGRGISKKNSSVSWAPYDWDEYSGYSSSTPVNHTPEETDHTQEESLSFCTRKQIDDDYAVLIGKYYCYDPYFGIGMELDGGLFAGVGSSGSNHFKPYSEYGWQLPIASSKEISDGEIIPNSFFKHSQRSNLGMINGFSNNTLGYVKRGYYYNKTDSDNGNLDNIFSDKSYAWAFAAVDRTLAYIMGAGSQRSELKKEDYNYDTVSTMQMGLRSILIEVDTRSSVVRKKSVNGSDFYHGLSNTPDHRYNSWFAPVNLSNLYEQSNWLGTDKDGVISNGTTNGYNVLPIRSTIASLYGEIGKAALGDYLLDNDIKAHFSNKSKDLVPFKHLCSIVRRVTPYGGYDKSAIEKTRYIPCGNFHPVTTVGVDPALAGVQQAHLSKVFGGDTFVNLYSHQKTSTPYMKKSAARFQVFPVESYVNTDMRSGLTLNAGDTVIGREMNEPPFSNDWLYNSIYSQQNNIKSGLTINEEIYDDSLDLPYEIAYSNTKILGQSSDAFRRFPINQFHDMEGLYGEINKIINFKNEIYILQDNAFAKLLVNPLSMLSDDAGTSLFTGTGETVENHVYISTKYGSRHKFSVAASEKSLYFVDSTFGRLFKYDTEKLISLGDALGQRNYLKYIIKEWEQRAYRVCTTTGDGTHPTLHGMLDSVDKPDGSRNYLSDNPLNFLGITSIYDFKNKELLVTFHNSAWDSKNNKRQQFVRTVDNHNMGSTLDGEPAGISETLVYSEAVNAFISKYSVAPPQWLTGGNGSFILCPENEMNINSIANFHRTTGSSGDYTKFPYSQYKTLNPKYRNKRYNPLKLWLWDKHIQQKKTNFFGRKDDVYKVEENQESTIESSESRDASVLAIPGAQFVADESYIVKVINTEAARAKVFDNVEIIMTPKYINFSTLDYTTDISHDTIAATSVLDNKTELLDETEQLVINRRWEFNGSSEGWYLIDGSGNIVTPNYNILEGAINLTFNASDDNQFHSPNKGELINLPGKYNNIIRMRLKRTSGSSSLTGTQDFQIFWEGHDPIRKKNGNFLNLGFLEARSNSNLSSNTYAGQTNQAYGPNLIVNGGFGHALDNTSAAGWSVGGSSGGGINPYQYSGGARIQSLDLSATGGSGNTSSYMKQDIMDISGDVKYRITYDILSNNGGGIAIEEAALIKTPIPSTVGSHTIFYTWLDSSVWPLTSGPSTGSTHTSNRFTIIRDVTGTDVVVDNVVVEKVLTPQAPIDQGYQIVEWNMSGIGDSDGTWDDCIIERIRIDLSGSSSGDNIFRVDWIEIGGLQADKYIDGVLKAPLRTEKSKRRTRGTWAKVKYSAKTTDKFNIFAILAKYRKTY
jgi:hypothetical protein